MDEVIDWKDRKRFMGLPLSFTKYTMDNNRLFVSRGLFTTLEDELVMYRVLDVRISRTIWDKLFGVGTVTLYTADETNRELKLEKIKKPREIRDMISEIAEAERAKLGIKGRELYGVAENVFEGHDN
ncbi:MAG TPA: PH domain-containing protein [Clostridiaceae bacterium]